MYRCVHDDQDGAGSGCVTPMPYAYNGQPSICFGDELVFYVSAWSANLGGAGAMSRPTSAHDRDHIDQSLETPGDRAKRLLGPAVNIFHMRSP